MEYRNFGRTGVKVSELCLGCMMFGGRTGEEDSADIIDRAIDEGINFLDTANVYSRGASEVAVGKALKRNGKRDEIVLATKVHMPMDDEDPNASGNHRRHIIEQCEASLRRLGVDHVDLYQIHRPSSDVPIDETLRALDDLIRAGKVRYAGTSTYAAWQLVEALWAARELGLNRFVTEQPPYHLLDRRIERELVPFARDLRDRPDPVVTPRGRLPHWQVQPRREPVPRRQPLRPRTAGASAAITSPTRPSRSSKRCKQSRMRKAAHRDRSPSPGARTNRA